MTCPYKEPTVNIKRGSKGEGAKWTQWYLNANGAKLKVDGVFGEKSVEALVSFQKRAGLVADAVSGAKTRSALRRGITGETVLKPNLGLSATLQRKINAMLDYIECRVGDLYVYGAQGQDACAKVIDESARKYPSITTPNRVAKMKSYLSTHKVNACGQTLKCFDCSGLFWAAENEVDLELGTHDTTAKDLFNRFCKMVDKKDLQPLDIVLNAVLTHMGIVGRNGKIYEASGSDIGVVVSGVDDRNVVSIYDGKKYKRSSWDKFGRLRLLDK